MSALPPAQTLLGPLATEKITKLINTAGQGNFGATNTDLSLHGRDKNEAGVVVTVVKATRPLNSFMAFRAYYAPIFSTLQQKYISGFLTYLWGEDLNKGKWSIVAKAYSVIRDKAGKKNAPLHTFLAINAPFMGITDPGAYMVTHGWEIVTRQDGCAMLRRAVEFATKQPGSILPITNASVDDVLRNSYAKGYVEEDLSDHVKPGNDVALTMATSAQPVGAPLATNLTANDAIMQESTAEGIQGSISYGSTTSEAVMSFQQNLDFDEPDIMSPVFPVTDQDAVSPGAMTFVDADFQSVYLPELSPMSSLNGNWPFNGEFVPTTNSLGFDPFGEDQFDAYHMSDVNDSTSAGWFNPSFP